MQVIDEKKRSKILASAAQLFAAKPFHKVLLSDVAEAAGVGKGTLYIYFKGKDELYLSVLYTGFSQLLERLRNNLDQSGRHSMQKLETAIREIIRFAYQNPYMFELMRAVSWRRVTDSGQWSSKRTELRFLVESIIRQGIARGELRDTHPELTANYIPGMVRSVMLDPLQGIDQEVLTNHVLHFIRSALQIDPPTP